MKENHSNPEAEAIALARFGLISRIEELIRAATPLRVALETAAACPLVLPDHTTRTVAYRTLEDWWYAYRHGGFAALYPKSRSDRGVPRVLSAQQEEWIVQQVQAHPAVSVKVLYRDWKGHDPSLPALSAIYRALRRHELDQRGRRYLTRQSISGPTKAFEAPTVNELWMVDFSPGPFIQVPDRKKALATHLCVILDDHSRLVVHAAYYPHANAHSFHQSFKQAIRRRGIPRKLYTDQGRPFTNDHTRIVCANLGIRLLHAKPYHSWSKGKVERVLYTIQQDLEAGLRLPGQQVHSLDELNARLADWLQCVYHVRVHEGTGMSPSERFARGHQFIHTLSPTQDLDRLFFTQVLRLVRKDGTVRLDNDLFEVDLVLRGLHVRLRFDPSTKDPVEVDYRGQRFENARRVDRHLNSRLCEGSSR